jgi:YYY domain-containing protein
LGDAIVWWITLEVLGLAAWPIAWVVMRRLPDRGWAFSKPLGLLLVGYFAWMLGMFQVAPFTRVSNILMLLALVGFAAWLVWRKDHALGREMVAFLRGQARYWICAEVFFAVAYIAWAILRAYSPNIFGTEKFMDFAFLNSFTQGHVLPPQDPWLAGYSINYYYFGYTLMGALCLLSGVDSAVGFNLANVTLFSLTALGCFGLVYNLVAGTLRARRGTVPTRTVAARAVAPSRATPAPVQARAATAAAPARSSGSRGSVALAEEDEIPPPRAARGGNGHSSAEPPPNGRSGRNGGTGPTAAALPARRFEEHAPVRWQALAAGVLAAVLVMVVGNLAGADQVINGHQTADTFNWWNPSRVIHDANAPLNGETINEFPFFSFMLNDMHPHMLALPFVLLVLALALALLKAGAVRPQDAVGALARRRGLLSGGLDGWLRLFVYALATGALFVANTWDYPTYLLIVLLALALPILGTPAARWLARPGRAASRSEGDESDDQSQSAARSSQSFVSGIQAWRDTRLGSWITQAAVLVVLGLLLFLPFQLTFKSFAGGGSGDLQVPPQIANIPVLGTLAEKLIGIIGVNIWPKTGQGFMTIFGFFLYAAVAWALVLLGRHILAGRAEGKPTDRVLLGLGGFVGVCWLGALVLQFPLLAVLPPLAGVALYLVWARLQPGRWSSEELFPLCLLGVGAVITFGTEIFFLQDVFHSRFNTLFKFYYQTWVLWGLVAAYGAWWLLAWAFGRRAVPGADASAPAMKLVAGAWTLGFAVLFILAMYYPVLAPAARDNGVVWLPGIQVANPQDHKLHGLDGIQYMGDQTPGDLEAIRWLRSNANGADGIAEAAYNIEYNVQGMHGRVSAFTGMPTIIAWTGHEVQWRGGQPQIAAEFTPRQNDEDELYATTDITRAKQIMAQYNLRYVFVGSIEKGAIGRPAGGQYSAEALSKFSQFMQPVFNQDGTTVYMLPEASTGAPSNAPNPGSGAPNPGALPHP